MHEEGRDTARTKRFARLRLNVGVFVVNRNDIATTKKENNEKNYGLENTNLKNTA